MATDDDGVCTYVGYLDRYLPTYGGDRRGNDRGRGNQAQELDGSPEEERDPPPGGRKGAMAPKRRK